MTKPECECCDGGLQYLCPSCKIPILVGKYSVTIDRARLKEAAMDELLKAAREIRDSIGIPFDKSTGYRAIEVLKLEKLRDALQAINALAAKSKR